MNIFKSLPALVALACTVVGVALGLVMTLWPVAAALVPPQIYPLVCAAVGVMLLILHYEQLLKDVAGVAAGTTPLATLWADFQKAQQEGFATVVARLDAQAKVAIPAAPAPEAPIVAAAAVVSNLAEAAPAVAQAAGEVAQALAPPPAPVVNGGV
jgi:hypothetical protein